jgi:ferredoxin
VHEFGPRVRLFKVFTNLPLVPDKPIDFGVTQFCSGCKKCAEACEVDAISLKGEPDWEPSTRSSSPGALKWYIDAESASSTGVTTGWTAAHVSASVHTRRDEQTSTQRSSGHPSRLIPVHILLSHGR